MAKKKKAAAKKSTGSKRPARKKKRAAPPPEAKSEQAQSSEETKEPEEMPAERAPKELQTCDQNFEDLVVEGLEVKKKINKFDLLAKWELGKLVNRLKSASKYGDHTVKEFADRIGENDRGLYHLSQVQKTFSKTKIIEICDQYPNISLSHLRKLSRVTDEPTRDSILKKASEQGLQANALDKVLKAVPDSKKSGKRSPSPERRKTPDKVKHTRDTLRRGLLAMGSFRETAGEVSIVLKEHAKTTMKLADAEIEANISEYRKELEGIKELIEGLLDVAVTASQDESSKGDKGSKK